MRPAEVAVALSVMTLLRKQGEADSVALARALGTPLHRDRPHKCVNVEEVEARLVGAGGLLARVRQGVWLLCGPGGAA